MDFITSLTNPTFLQALIMVLREGLESILIFAALCLYLIKLDAPQRLPALYGGAAAALVASVLTGWVAVTYWQVADLHAGVEGLFMLGAAVLVFYVSGWLYYRQDPAIWTKYLKDKVARALATQTVWPLVLLAFLAIYREGLETVLFLMALASQAGGWVWPIWEAVLVGSAVLVVLYFAIRKFALRLPLRPVFLVTSAVLFLMGLHLVIEGVHELQEVAWLPMTSLGLGEDLTLEQLLPALMAAGSAVAGIFCLRGKGGL
ncbi:MAG: FTR1 family protein [Alphaproteobacteria bacterium]|nr:FTR1 family protein [Alphaproteobacteria bacterium]